MQNALIQSPDRVLNTILPKRGVVTLSGYGIGVRVDRGHLSIEDGIGEERRKARLPRIGHGLKRLVVVGSDGVVSLSALRWLADQDAAFVMLDRDGSVLSATGPVRPSDVRLRRAQALAHHSGAAVEIARELIKQKLIGQERVAREQLANGASAESIAEHRSTLDKAESIDAIRLIESRAASVYWAAWSGLTVVFPKRDVPRVPEHWRVFTSRSSPLTGSQRLAVNPINAMLNYLYSILEAEARLAASALGLDPGLGFLHADLRSRDSLACDLMEPVRPKIDAFVLDWIMREPLKREWLFEKRDGNCRLMAEFTERLSESAPAWGRAIAPHAEWVAKLLWSKTRVSAYERPTATRLTQQNKKDSRGGAPVLSTIPVMRRKGICRECGTETNEKRPYCAKCAYILSKGSMIERAKKGRIASHSPSAEAKRSLAQQRQRAAERSFNPSSLPAWLDKDAYLQNIQPKLSSVTVSAIASALRVSRPYAAAIRNGKHLPHPRHWEKLAGLAGIETEREP